MNRSTPPFNDLPAVDVAIIGGGLAGSICALLLARQGIGVAIIDPFKVYPADFRCEKLTRDQIKRTTRLGIDGPLLEAAAPVTETVVARNGRAIDLRSVNEVCQRYDTMVNAVRRAWPDQVVFHEGRAAGIATSTGEQIVTLTSGARLKARLVILATGPGEKLRANLGLQRRAVRYNHSVCIGFDLVNGTGGPISRRALTYYGEKPGDGVAFATVFPFGNRTRCNVFCYLDPAGAQISAVRANPIAGLATLLPGLIPILGNDVRLLGAPKSASPISTKSMSQPAMAWCSQAKHSDHRAL